MPYFLMPLSFLTKEYIAGFLTIPLILMVITLFYNFCRGKKEFYLPPEVFMLSAVLVLIQAIINFSAGLHFANYDSLAHFFQFIKIIILFFLNYVFIRQVIRQRADAVKFLRGTIIFLGMALIVGFIQRIYVKTGLFQPIVRIIGKFGEATWNNPRFYQNGSYVETTTRINGFSQEASVFASQIGILGFPPLLALLKNKFKLFPKLKSGNFWLYIALFLGLSILSIFIKSTSGLIFLILSSSFFFLNIFNKQNKKIQIISFTMLMLLLFLLMALYFFSDSNIRGFLNDYLIKKNQNDSGINRTLITKALFRTFFEHPLFGVGFSGAFLFGNVKGMFANNSEFINLFLNQPYLPQLSELGQFLANYGLVFCAPIIVFFSKIKLNFFKLKHHNQTQDKLIPVINDMMTYFLIFFIIGQISVIRSVNSCYLFTICFFIAAFTILASQNELSAQTSESS